jgi:hypothetical protein
MRRVRRLNDCTRAIDCHIHSGGRQGLWVVVGAVEESRVM